MAKTYFFKSQPNIAGTGRTGGYVTSDAVIRDVAPWVKELEPRKTPLSTRIGYGKPINILKHEVGQSYHTPVSTTLAGSVANNATTITLAAGSGQWLQDYMVLEVIDYLAGSTTVLDYATREEMIVTGLPGAYTDTPTVIRDVKNRTSATVPASGSWPTHSSGAVVNIVGVAMPQNTDFTLSPTTSGDVIFNYPQRYFGMVGSDMAARSLPTYESKGDRLLHDLERETTRQKYFLEKAVAVGTRLEGDGATLPYKMGGILYYLDGGFGANVTNLAGALIRAYDIEDLMRDQFKKLDAGGDWTAIMGVDTAACFDALLNPMRQATVADSSLNLTLDTIKFRWGSFDIQPTFHFPEGYIAFVDFKNFSIRPWKGMDWQVKDIPTSGPYDRKALFGDFTLHVESLPTMSLIKGINYDVSLYPRKTWF